MEKTMTIVHLNTLLNNCGLAAAHYIYMPLSQSYFVIVKEHLYYYCDFMCDIHNHADINLRFNKCSTPNPASRTQSPCMVSSYLI